MSSLKLSLLGSFQARLDNQPVDKFQSDKARGLLAYLIIEAEQSHRRDKLAGLLWPDYPNKNARDNLRHTLANLRLILDDRQREIPLLLSDRHNIRLNPKAHFDCDITRFRAGVSSSAQIEVGNVNLEALREAVAVYRGSFLEGFYLPDCESFEEWISFTRERFQREAQAALKALAQYHEEEADFQNALVYTKRLLTLDPLEEECYRTVMRLLAHTGQRSAALAQYENCVRMLRNEFGIDPENETRTLHQQIQSGQFAEQAPFVSREGITPAPQHHQQQQHNLPTFPTSFVGREAALDTIVADLQSAQVRLLTIYGPAGVGKTRLAIEAAHTLTTHFVDGVFFTELAPLQSQEQLLFAIANTVGLKPTHNASLEDELVRYLRQRDLLLICDNFEHLLHAAPLVADLLTQLPLLKVLCTSRNVLDLYGEYACPVSPLALPLSDRQAAIENWEDFSALELINHRGKAASTNFSIGRENIEVVIKLCDLLDCLPLALEFAAARFKYLSVEQVFAQLTEQENSQLLSLSTRERDRTARHRSLYDAIAWSYQLLQPNEQLFFRRLAIFTGGCTVSAAQSVCDPDGDLDGEACLLALAEFSLVRIDRHDLEEERIFLLETSRVFGLEQLKTEDELAAVEAQFAEYYISWVENLFRRMDTIDTAHMNQFEMEESNLQTIREWVLQNERINLGLRLGRKLRWFWRRGTYLAQHYQWLQKLLAITYQAPASTHFAETLFSVGFGASILGKIVYAGDCLERCLAMSTEVKDDELAGYAAAILGNTHFSQGDYEATRNYHQQSLAIRQRLDLQWETGMILMNMGSIDAELGDFKNAETKLLQSLEYIKPTGNAYGLGVAYSWLGLVKTALGDLDTAREIFEKGLQISEAAQLDAVCAGLLQRSAELEMVLHNFEKAERNLLYALKIFYQGGGLRYTLSCLEDLTILRAHQGQAEQALNLAALTEQLHAKIETVRPPMRQARFDSAISMACDRLDIDGTELAQQQNQPIDFESTVASLLAK